MTATSVCHLLFGGQICREADEESQETPVAPGETVRAPPAVTVTWVSNQNLNLGRQCLCLCVCAAQTDQSVNQLFLVKHWMTIKGISKRFAQTVENPM